MDQEDPLASDACSPLVGPVIWHASKHGRDNEVTIFCDCGHPAEYVVDPHVPNVRRSVCHQRMCAHDVWFKRSPTRKENAATIRTLKASVNNLKAKVLEKGHAIRVVEDTNMNLKFAISCAERRKRAWMITSAALTTGWVFTVLVRLLA